MSARVLLAGMVVAATVAAAVGGEPPQQRLMAVTFDDLPFVNLADSNEVLQQRTASLLASIARHRIPAVGFVVGGKLVRDGEVDPGRRRILEMWLDAGLELGNHTYSHPDLHRAETEDYLADVARGAAVLEEVVAERHVKPRFFRHPMLHTGTSLQVRDAVVESVHQQGYRVAPVSMDNQEWIYARAYDVALGSGDKELAAQIATEYLDYMNELVAYWEAQSQALLGRQLRHVLLLHANRLNAEHFEELARSLTERGYQFISLEEALQDPAYQREESYTGKAGISWLHRLAISEGKRGSFFAGEPDASELVHATAGF